jgi:hypothetical protein
MPALLFEGRLLFWRCLFMSYVPLSKFKTFSKICSDDATQDDFLNMILISSEAVVQNWLGRKLEQNTTTEYLTGTGKRSLILRHRPVLSIVSVYEDFNGHFGTSPGSFSSSQLLASGRDYMLDLDTNGTSSSSGILYRINSNWLELGREFVPGKLTPETGSPYGNIKVTYTHGYAAVPDDIIFATCMVASYMKRNIGIGGDIKSEKLGDYSYTLGGNGLDSRSSIPEIASAMAILSRYRECAW